MTTAIASKSNNLVAASSSNLSIGDRVASLISALPTNSIEEGRIKLLIATTTLATPEERWAARVAHAVLCGHGARYTDWSASLGAAMPWNSAFHVPAFMTKCEQETRDLREQIARTEVMEGLAELVRAVRAEAPALQTVLGGMRAEAEAERASA